MITNGKGSATAGILTSAPQGSVYNKVFLNNMNEDSYSSKYSKLVETMLSTPRTTMFTVEAGVVTTWEYYNCLVGLISFYIGNEDLSRSVFHIRLKRSG